MAARTALGKITHPFLWFYDSFGLSSIHATGRNAYLIILARSCRMFAYGTNSLILALFFAELKFSDSKIGLFMTLTLLGDVFLGIVLTLIADRVGRRRILFGGSFLMVLSGVCFGLFENFWVLLAAAVVGVVSATGGDFGPFRAIEESVLSQLTTPDTRADVLAWYVTFSAWGSSIGSEASGRIIEYLRHLDGWTLAGAYHSLFWIYAVMGLVNAGLTLLLTEACEAGTSEEKYAQVAQDETDDGDFGIEMDETPQPSPAEATAKPLDLPRSKLRSWILWLRNWMADISAPTAKVMYKLWLLLALDSLADGMVPYSLTNYYMDTKFHPAKSTLGDVASISYFLAAFSGIFAGPLARRIGLINTMVFTHIPSSAAVLVFPFPSQMWLTVALLFIRAGLNNMDQAPRSAFIAAVVKPEERTAVMGITSMLRTLAATIGPTVTGFLAGNNRFWVAFVAAGTFRLAYDVGLYALFVNMKLHAHERKDVAAVERRGVEDEEMANGGGHAEVEVEVEVSDSTHITIGDDDDEGDYDGSDDDKGQRG